MTPRSIQPCPFCGGAASPLDENDHTSCSNISCGSTAYMHVDAWNRADNQQAAFIQSAYDQGRADAAAQIAPHLHLIEVFCDDITARNWADKADYIKQQAGRIRAIFADPQEKE